MKNVKIVIIQLLIENNIFGYNQTKKWQLFYYSPHYKFLLIFREVKKTFFKYLLGVNMFKKV